MRSPRLRAIADALPRKPGLRILEIGCGPGAMARELSIRIENGSSSASTALQEPSGRP